ncbi:MAG: LytTR family DNA-binding domain-containing protein, partial [Pirellulales bacterium]
MGTTTSSTLDRGLVVFVTAYGSYALRAFKYGAFDYVEKPIDPVRFSQVLDRIHQRGKKLLNAVRQDVVYRECEIQIVENAGNFVNVRIKDESYLVRESLDNFCCRLNSPDFVHVHHSFVVNVQWVRKMQYGKSDSAELYLTDGPIVPVSRSRRSE